VTENQEAIVAAMKLLSIAKESVPADKRQELMKQMSALSDYGAMEPAMSDDEKAKKAAEDKAAAEKAAAEEAAKNKKDEYPMMPVKKSDGSYDLSSVPEAARTMVEALWKSHDEAITKSEAANKRAEDAEKILKEQKDAEVKKEFVAKAADLKNLSVNADEFGAVMKELHEKAPEQFAKVETVLKAANEAVKKAGLFAELGSANSGSGASDTAEAALDKAVASIVQKSDGKVTKEQAYSEFITSPEGSKLYARYVNERG